MRAIPVRCGDRCGDRGAITTPQNPRHYNGLLIDCGDCGDCDDKKEYTEKEREINACSGENGKITMDHHMGAGFIALE